MRIRANRLLVCCGFAAIVFQSPAIAFTQQKLRWRFVAGQKRQLTVIQKQKTTVSLQTQKMTTTVDRIIDGVWKVNAIGEQGVADITQNLTRIRMKVTKSQGPGFDIDTDAYADRSKVDECI